MLKLKNISKYYTNNGVTSIGLNKINLELNLGEFVVITGESGSGKSTLLNVLSALDCYEEGEMYINGEETSYFKEEDYLKYRRKYISNIFQYFNLINSYTVYENILLAYIMNGYSKKDASKLIDELINKVHLNKYKNTLISKLSGGQKQRVGIARALALNTKIIIADEPTGALDSKASKEILELLYNLSKDKLVIIVTHNKEEILKYATRLIRMSDGKIIEDKQIKKINLDKQIVPKTIKNINNINKFKLAFKNSYNIPIKLFLMIIVFSLIVVTLSNEYASLRKDKIEGFSNISFNPYFTNLEKERIIVKKNNNETFKEDDLNKIKSIKGINNIIEDDVLLDYKINLYNDKNTENFLNLDGSIHKIKNETTNIGKIPQNDYEILIKGNKSNYSLNESILGDGYSILINNIIYDKNITIVGIIYNDVDNYNEDVELYMTENFYNILKNNILYSLSNTSTSLKNIEDVIVIPNDKLKKGEVYINDLDCNNCLNNYIKFSVDNINYFDNVSLKVKDTFNKNNYKNMGSYYLDNLIYMSKEDYNYLYNKGNYQISVFAEDIKDIYTIENNLKELGYSTFILKDATSNSNLLYSQIMYIFKIFIIIILLITLFFISYFIIKIIYKGRNSYYATLRTLGGNKKICTSILRLELIILGTFVYAIFILFMILINNNIVRLDYFNNICKYIRIIDYFIIYIILILLSIFISNKYGKKMFKERIIESFKEEL